MMIILCACVCRRTRARVPHGHTGLGDQQTARQPSGAVLSGSKVCWLKMGHIHKHYFFFVCVLRLFESRSYLHSTYRHGIWPSCQLLKLLFQVYRDVCPGIVRWSQETSDQPASWSCCSLQRHHSVPRHGHSPSEFLRHHSGHHLFGPTRTCPLCRRAGGLDAGWVWGSWRREGRERSG